MRPKRVIVSVFSFVCKAPFLITAGTEPISLALGRLVKSNSSSKSGVKIRSLEQSPLVAIISLRFPLASFSPWNRKTYLALVFPNQVTSWVASACEEKPLNVNDFALSGIEEPFAPNLSFPSAI